MLLLLLLALWLTFGAVLALLVGRIARVGVLDEPLDGNSTAGRSITTSSHGVRS